MAVEILLFRSRDPHIAWVFPSKPPWEFLQFLGRHPDPPYAATGIPDVVFNDSTVLETGNGHLCHRKIAMILDGEADQCS